MANIEGIQEFVKHGDKCSSPLDTIIFAQLQVKCHIGMEKWEKWSGVDLKDKGLLITVS